MTCSRIVTAAILGDCVTGLVRAEHASLRPSSRDRIYATHPELPPILPLEPGRTSAHCTRRIPRRRLLAALLAVLAACGADTKGPIDGKAALRHVSSLAKEPRPAGSPALQQAAQYLKDQLGILGLTAQEDVWTDPNEKLTFRNLWVEIPGNDPAKGPILGIGAHYDTKKCEGHPNPEHNFRFVGAIDGGGGPAVLLELARVLKDRKRGPNIWLIWLDGEESIEFDWNDKRALFGSRRFVTQAAADKQRFPSGLAARMKVFVLLDLVGDKNPKVDRDPMNNGDLNKIFAAAGAEIGAKERMFLYEHSYGVTDDHAPFRERGVSVINLIDFHFRIPERLQKVPQGQRAALRPEYQAWWHTPEDTVERMSADSLAFFGNLVIAAIPAIEREFYQAR